MVNVSTACTDDALFGGRLICRQHKNGYRFSVDAVLVAHYARVCAGDAVLDLGTGCGVIPLILYYRYRCVVQVTAIELQQQLAALAVDNVASNRAAAWISIINADVRNIAAVAEAESFSAVICNPPFYKPDSGRVSSVAEAAVARHQLHGELIHFLKAASFAVKNHGLVTFIYPAESLTELLGTAADCRLELCRIRPVYSYRGNNKAILVLAQFRKNGGRQLLLEEPLYIYTKKNGEFTQEMQAMYAP